jgi:titin
MAAAAAAVAATAADALAADAAAAVVTAQAAADGAAAAAVDAAAVEVAAVAEAEAAVGAADAAAGEATAAAAALGVADADALEADAAADAAEAEAAAAAAAADEAAAVADAAAAAALAARNPGGAQMYALGEGQAAAAVATVAAVADCIIDVVPVTPPGNNTGGPNTPNPTPEVTPIGAVRNVTAEVRTSSILVSWNAPLDDSAVVGYEAFANPLGAQSSQDMVSCIVTSAVRTCLLGVEAGQAYGVGVYAFDGDANLSEPANFVETSVVPAPVKAASVPAGNATLEGPSGPITKVTAGQTMTLVGKNYLPFSTVALYVYSEPTFLRNVTADANGGFTVEVTIPANLVNGEHSLVASGVDINGNPYVMRADFTLSGGVAATGGSGGLAYTGASVAVPLIGGLAALGLGGGLLVASRRRNTSEA